MVCESLGLDASCTTADYKCSRDKLTFRDYCTLEAVTSEDDNKGKSTTLRGQHVMKEIT